VADRRSGRGRRREKFSNSPLLSFTQGHPKKRRKTKAIGGQHPKNDRRKEGRNQIGLGGGKKRKVLLAGTDLILIMTRTEKDPNNCEEKKGKGWDAVERSPHPQAQRDRSTRSAEGCIIVVSFYRTGWEKRVHFHSGSIPLEDNWPDSIKKKTDICDSARLKTDAWGETLAVQMYQGRGALVRQQPGEKQC